MKVFSAVVALFLVSLSLAECYSALGRRGLGGGGAGRLSSTRRVPAWRGGTLGAASAETGDSIVTPAATIAETAESGVKPAATIAGLARWDPQAWVVPAVWNTPVFQAVALCGVLAAVATGSAALQARAAAFLHLVAFGALFGSTVYTTFFAGITMYKNLPRQMFGRLQSKLFPLYFKLHAASLVMMMGTLQVLGTAAGLSTRSPFLYCSVALAATLVNIFYLEPQSTKVMFKRYDLENEGKQDTDEYKAAAKKFGPLHGLSSLANLVALVGTVAHSWWLGGVLRF